MTTPNPIQILYNHNDLDDSAVDINIVKSPAKFEIIELLRNEEMSFEDIVLNVSKSKSAVSVHLKSLREVGIVNYKLDPSDNRRKIFYLESDFIGSINTKKISRKENKTDLLINEFVEKGEIEYVLLFVKIFKSVLIDFGIDFNPILETIGEHIGSCLFNQLYDEDIHVYTDNISEYWLENNLGKISFDLKHNIKIKCMECFECHSIQKTGKPMCFLEKGMYKKLFSEFFKFDMSIEEIRCHSMGDEECVFELVPQKIF
ncbi:MAG: ArsR family transcriptional regulator [Methanobrevibacter sp.]|nr:ArsR family transcriptional regulator [Methanobrevibacter sp.]